DQTGGEYRECRQQFLVAQRVQLFRRGVREAGSQSVRFFACSADPLLIGDLDQIVPDQVADVPVQGRDRDIGQVLMELVSRQLALAQRCLDDAESDRMEQCG